MGLGQLVLGQLVLGKLVLVRLVLGQLGLYRLVAVLNMGSVASFTWSRGSWSRWSSLGLGVSDWSNGGRIQNSRRSHLWSGGSNWHAYHGCAGRNVAGCVEDGAYSGRCDDWGGDGWGSLGLSLGNWADGGVCSLVR